MLGPFSSTMYENFKEYMGERGRKQNARFLAEIGIEEIYRLLLLK